MQERRTSRDAIIRAPKGRTGNKKRRAANAARLFSLYPKFEVVASQRSIYHRTRHAIARLGKWAMLDGSHLRMQLFIQIEDKMLTNQSRYKLGKLVLPTALIALI